jgi:hypothetical protein
MTRILTKNCADSSSLKFFSELETLNIDRKVSAIVTLRLLKRSSMRTFFQTISPHHGKSLEIVSSIPLRLMMYLKLILKV